VVRAKVWGPVLAAVASLAAACQSGGTGVPTVPSQATGASPAAASARQLIERFGPMVYLASEERFEPTTAENFISNSTLLFRPAAHCPAPVIAAPADAARLSAGYVAAETTDDCSGEVKTWRSNSPSRPAHRDAVGFFLDIDSSAYHGIGTAAPAYVQYKDRSYVMYWLLYAYNQQPVRPVDQLFDHEGDWERVAVLLDAANYPTDVVYFGHGGKCRVPWSKAPKEGEHPIAYSAKGTHASYPGPGIHRAGIDQTSAGTPWRTWQNLRLVDDEPWRDYGGGWGNVGQGPHATGPEGPHRNRNVDSVWDAQPCGVNHVPEQLLGEWKSLGPVDQPSADNEYSAELTIRGGTTEDSPIGSSYYPGLECRGDLYLLGPDRDEQGRDGIRVREVITKQPLHKCGTEVDINLTRDHYRDQLHYTVLDGTAGPATATLTPK
jgi:hypothetical protein